MSVSKDKVAKWVTAKIKAAAVAVVSCTSRVLKFCASKLDSIIVSLS